MYHILYYENNTALQNGFTTVTPLIPFHDDSLFIKLSKGTTFHTVRRKQKAGKHNMRCSFPLFFCQHIYILYFFAFEMHTPNL